MTSVCSSSCATVRMQRALLAPPAASALHRTRFFRPAQRSRAISPVFPVRQQRTYARLVPSAAFSVDAVSPSALQHISAADIQSLGLDLTSSLPTPAYELSEGLETPLQLLYLLCLLGLLSVGAYLVVRQVLVRRELDEAAKALGERIRTGDATCEDYFELGVILTRKKLYTQATKNLEKAKKVWEGEETELAQVHNALGFCYFNMGKNEIAVKEYQRAVELQPGYVTAWNNLGDVYEADKNWKSALQSYQEALSYAPDNTVALQRSDLVKNKVERLGLM